jgi:hypothetical protein
MGFSPCGPAGFWPLFLRVSGLSLRGILASLLAGYGHLSLRVTGHSFCGFLASLFAGYWPLSSRVAGLSLCGLLASLPCGLWASLFMGYWPLFLRGCGLLASLFAGCWPLSSRVTGLSLRGLLASLPAGYGRSPCGLRAFSLRVTGVSTGCWSCSLYGLQLRICQYRNSDTRLYGRLASLSLLVADLPVPQIWRASSSLQLMAGACLSRCLPCLQCSVLLCLLC